MAIFETPDFLDLLVVQSTSLSFGVGAVFSTSISNSGWLAAPNSLLSSSSSSYKIRQNHSIIYDWTLSSRSELTREKNSTTHFLLEGHLVCHMPKAHIATLIG